MQSKSTFPARIAPFSVFLLFYRKNGSGSGTEKGAITKNTASTCNVVHALRDYECCSIPAAEES